MRYLAVFWLLGCLIFPQAISAQRGVIKQAKAHYERQDYARVLEVLKDIANPNDKSKVSKMLGVAFAHTGSPKKAIMWLQSYLNEVPDDTEAMVTLADAYLLDGQYVKAADVYKFYIGKEEPGAEEMQQLKLKLLHCQNGQRLSTSSQLGFVESLGPIVNSAEHEIMPVASRNHESRFYFTSNRPSVVGGLRNKKGLKDEEHGSYYFDMFRVDINQEGFATVRPIAPLVNSSAHDYIGGFNEEGDVLYFVKDQGPRGAFVVSDTLGAAKEPSYYPAPVDLPIVPSAGDRDFQFVHDTILLFSSKRTGGLGGYDLWISTKKDSTWLEPVNLGPKVNTPFDERHPFMTHDGLELFYSSDRPESIGGMDIFRQRFSMESNSWSPARNLKKPINSTADDTGFTLEIGGARAVLASNRPGGEGGSDLYMVYLKEPIQVGGKNLLRLGERYQSDASMVGDSLIIEALQPFDKEQRLPARELVLSEVVYAGTAGLADMKVDKVLKTIADALKVYPETEVLIQSRVPAMGSYSRELFFAVKQSEVIQKKLWARGVPRDRVFIEGLPSRDNNYAFFPVLRSRTAALRVSHIDPSFASVDGIRFRVLHKNALQMLQDDVLKDISCTIVRKENEATYQYFAKSVLTYAEAKELRLQVLRLDPDSEAQIVPFTNGIPLSLKEVKDLAVANPQLEQYLEDQ